MEKFLLSGSPTLVTALARALIETKFPESEIEVLADADDAPGVRVSLVGAAGWLAIIPHATATDVSHALVSGAVAILTLDSSPAELDRALGALRNGEGPVLPGRLVHLLASREVADRGRELTRREHEVLQLLAAGCSNQEIASTLHISVNTVRTHLQALSSKLGITGRARLAAYAFQRTLASDASFARPA